MTQCYRLHLLLAGFFLFWPCSSQAITLHVTDDTEIRVGGGNHFTHKRNNFWHSQRELEDDSPDRHTLSVRHSRHGKESIGLARFDVSPLPPGSQIERAILRMWINESHQEGLLNLHEVLESWKENKMPANQLPPLAPVFSSIPIGKSDEEKFLSIDVTTVVQEWLDHPATNLGLAFVSDDTNRLHVEIDSKENRRTSHPMEIEVTLKPGIGPEGPQGLQGPMGIQGPPGPTGPAVQLLMLGKNCLPGEFLTGFDVEGNIICRALPLENPQGPSEVQDANPGDIIITEIMSNPNAVNDTDGEWFEIFNTRAETVNIAGWLIQDGGGSHLISTSTSLLIAPGEFLVLGNNANMITNGGISVDYQYAGITLNNGEDTITLSDVNNEEIDSVDYGMGFLPPPSGISLNLDIAHFNGHDNDNGSFWCPSTTLIGPGQDVGTPGTANESCSLVP